MAATATTLGLGATDLCLSGRLWRPSSDFRRSIAARNADTVSVDMLSGDLSKSPQVTRIRRSVQARASDPDREVDGGSDDASSFKDDWSYLFKAGVGSVAGAAVIKYGSIMFPEITRPNFLQALIMISTPMIVAVFLMIQQSREVE